MSSSSIRGIRRKKSSLSEVKIAVIGAPSVGKSALVVRFLTKRYIGEYDHQAGSTKRRLRERMAEHMGISGRTLQPLQTKPHSVIRTHAEKCNLKLSFDHFKIINQTDDNNLLISESILIKQRMPPLNMDSSSVPLYVE